MSPKVRATFRRAVLPEAILSALPSGDGALVAPRLVRIRRLGRSNPPRPVAHAPATPTPSRKETKTCGAIIRRRTAADDAAHWTFINDLNKVGQTLSRASLTPNKLILDACCPTPSCAHPSPRELRPFLLQVPPQAPEIAVDSQRHRRIQHGARYPHKDREQHRVQVAVAANEHAA
mgnify:CR=1 FL=1